MVKIENEGEGRESGAEKVKDYNQELMSSLYRSINNISENNVAANKEEYKELINNMKEAGLSPEGVFSKFTKDFVFGALRSPASYTKLLNQMEIFSQVAGVDLKASIEDIQDTIMSEITDLQSRLANLKASGEKDKRNLYE